MEKPLFDFHASAKSSDGRASWCKPCTNGAARTARRRTYRAEDKRRWQLKTRYGLSEAAVSEMLAKQNGKCALCDVELSKFHIDHCHNTKKVRGLLCHGCNIRLGGWDNIPWRERALKYLGLQVEAQQ